MKTNRDHQEILDLLRLCIPWLLDAHKDRMKQSIIRRDGYRGTYKKLADKAISLIAKKGATK